MARKLRTLFLERSSYRRRRVMDALKLLVFLGTILWMVPTLWPTTHAPGTEAVRMSSALFYVFGVWLLLIGLAAVFQRTQSTSGRDTEQSDDTP